MKYPGAPVVINLSQYTDNLVLFQYDISGLSVPVVVRSRVAALAKGTIIALRLAANHHRDAQRVGV